MSDVAIEEFIDLFMNVKSTLLARELLSLMFTLDEIDDIAGRVNIVKALLDRKLPQREISSEYGVSIAKVTRGSNALKIISPDLKAYLREALLN